VDWLISVVTVLNAITNAIFGVVFAPCGWMPGWLSNTLISAVMGVALLFIFKHTSNQTAIGRVRDSISANLLAVRLYKDNISVTLRSQGRVFLASFKLLYYSIVPLLVMMVPVILVLAQMGLWYQFAPLRKGSERVIVKLELGEQSGAMPNIEMEPNDAVEVELGPVRAASSLYWRLKMVEDGEHRLVFRAGEKRVEKQLVIGRGYKRINPVRPGRNIWDVVLYPLEKPFASDSAIQSISVEYPARDSFVSGTDWWIIYFFVVSMIFAFAFKPYLKVRI
jgi:hypothetical protein